MLGIVIPFYKLSFFRHTLQSLSDQTDKRFKVYIGDDNSPENPIALLNEYESKIDFVYHRFDNNLGGAHLVKQWERCINLCSNENWIVILGDDDVVSLNFVEKFYSILDTGLQCDLLRFAVQKINEANVPISDLYTNLHCENVKDILFKSKRSSLSEYVFRKSKLLSVGLKDFPLGWWSDILAVLECSGFSNIYSINDAYVNVRISKLSISGSEDNSMQKQNATYEFYNYLLTIKNNYFLSSELLILEHRLDKIYLNDRKNLKLFINILILYFKTRRYNSIKHLIYRVLDSFSYFLIKK